MSEWRLSLVHPTGHPFSRNAAIAFAEAGLLQEIITTLAFNPQGAGAQLLKSLPGFLGKPLLQELSRRTWIPPAGVPIQTHPWRELLRLGLGKTGLSRSWGGSAQGPVAWLYASLDHHVSQQHLQGIQAIYAYEDSAADTFTAAKALGIHCIYDLPIVFYEKSRQIQVEEATRFPDLAPALQAAREPAWKIERKQRELALADRIIVPSTFVEQSLLEVGVAAEKIRVVPFGAPIDYFLPQPKPDDRFRALFVGRIGPRKGVHYLLRAWQSLQFPQADLHLVGVNEFPIGWLAPYEHLFHQTASVPHLLLNQYYSTASVLVLPTLVEGLALVLLEAMSCGIPVITTDHSGGADIITSGVEGWIVPARDEESLKDRLEWCYSHPKELREMGRAARLKAEQLTWKLYQHRLVSSVQELFLKA